MIQPCVTSSSSARIPHRAALCRPSWLASTVLLAALAACGGGGGASHDDHGQTHIDTRGRLSIADSEAPLLHVFDLDTHQIQARHTLKAPASAVYASPGKRYALAIQRMHDRVQLVDGGIWQEDHGDHQHDYRQPSTLLDWQLDGVRPTHYNPLANGSAALFMDGKAGDTPQINAGAQVISDVSIRDRKLLASQTLPTPMHGAALPMDDVLLTTLRTAPATASDVLPERVQIHHRQGSAYQPGQTLPTACPRLHGADASGTHAAFGCADGVLLITRNGNQFSDRKIEMPTRAASLYSHASRPGHFIAIGNAGTPATTHFHAIDGSTGTATRVIPDGWQDGQLRRSSIFDRRGSLHILDSSGALYTLRFSEGHWQTVRRTAGVLTMPEAAPWPVLVASGARDELYLSDPKGRQILHIDSNSHNISRRDQLDFNPAGMTWTGISR
ncbi:MAG: hypothetical protein Q4E06_12050 [Lautropia sp.]|nr:hypothetical protein [Lautropia sp.]